MDPLLSNTSEKINNHGWCPELIKKAEINAYYFPNFILEIKNPLLRKILIILQRKLINQLRKIINLKRKIFVKYFEKKKEDNFNKFKIVDLSKYSETYKEKGYCFVENFFDQNTYKKLMEHWPSENYFPTRAAQGKFYSFSIKYDLLDPVLLKEKSVNEKIKEVKNLDNIPLYKNFYKFLLSTETNLNFKKLMPDSENEIWNFCLTILTSAKEKSFLIPHIDGYIRNEEIPKSCNVGIFLDGNNNNAIGSGSLGLYEDNQFKKPIFIPTNLKNCALIYDTQKKFYHGFNFMEKNCYRKTINLAYMKC